MTQAHYPLPVMDARKMQVKPALLLDIDGTIRHSRLGKRFIEDAGDIALFPDVEDKLWGFRNRGYLILGVSNQGGVAFMIKPQSIIMQEMDATVALFKRNPFHSIKMCLHHPNGKHPALGHRSLMRKPDIGMLVMHEYECFGSGWIIDWSTSLMVGDRDEDRVCAERASIEFKWAWEFFGREQPDTTNQP